MMMKSNLNLEIDDYGTIVDYTTLDIDTLSTLL